jgi:hypothetical protein
MIVRDEAPRIETCLESVLPFLRTWVVCDTGSRDDTAARVEAFFRRHGLPGELLRHEWRDFRHNRNRLASAARGRAPYLLMPDADIRVEVRQPALLGQMNHDAVAVRMAGQPASYMVRILRGDLDWQFSGVTHEEPVVPGRDIAYLRTDGIVFHHQQPPGTLEGKIRRDLAWLERESVEDPLYAPTWFYLGNAHAALMVMRAETDAEHGRRAIAAYTRRLQLEGHPEERYLAQLKLARVRMLMEGFTWESFGLLVGAHALRPTRVEALHEAVRYCRKLRLFTLGCQLAEPALDLPPPTADFSEIDEDLHRFGLLEEYTRCAFGSGRIREAVIALERILAVPDLPAESRERARENLVKARAAMAKMFPSNYSEPTWT